MRGTIAAALIGAALAVPSLGAPPAPEAPPPAAEAAEVADAAGEGAFDRRLAEERTSRYSRFALTPHKPNYLILSYNRHPSDQYEALEGEEIKYQLSIKIAFVDDLFGGDVYFGYSQLSLWQAFNSELSGPFRETNYEPELMWQFVRPKVAGSLANRAIVLGFSHQSNGRSLPQSRSWNRLYANFVFEYDDFYLSVKPWYRIPEPAKTDPADTTGDDNPDITDYLGYGELNMLWVSGPRRLGLMLRNNLDRHDNHGALQLDWVFPIHGRLHGYAQYFNGYGETLIDYNHAVQRLGIGLILNHWL
jgi:phospholipase A1